MTSPNPTPAAERQREYRARDKSGSLWASAFVPRDLAEKLITSGLLPESESSDKKSLGEQADGRVLCLAQALRRSHGSSTAEEQ